MNTEQNSPATPLPMLTDDEWDWLSLFLGYGAGAYGKEDPERAHLILLRSVTLMNKLDACRRHLQKDVPCESV